MKVNKEFCFYSEYKNKWVLPIVFGIILLASIVVCILFKFIFCNSFIYDISLSIFTGTIVFFLTQIILYINKLPKINMQKDKSILFTVQYKLNNINKRVMLLNDLQNEVNYKEFKKLLKESYKTIHDNKKTINKTSKILAKRFDEIYWCYFFFVDQALTKVSYEDFITGEKLNVENIGVDELDESQLLTFFKEKISILDNQAQDLFNDFCLFYRNEKGKIYDEIF